MKLSNRQPDRIRLELSMTSMIDVVFLLLIFFLVTTTFAQPQAQLSSNITVNSESTSTPPKDLEPAVIKLSLVNQSVTYELGGLVTVDFSELTRLLETYEGKEQGAFVYVSDDVPFGEAAKLIGVCRSLGFSTVSYLPLR